MKPRCSSAFTRHRPRPAFHVGQQRHHLCTSEMLLQGTGLRVRENRPPLALEVIWLRRDVSHFS